MTHAARYVHTNLVARDWRRLAQFYQDALGCQILAPERDLSGPEMDALTGILGVRILGAHLRLPGHGPEGPTLEIFEYEPAGEADAPAVDQPGLGHLAFQVEDVQEALERVIGAGGSALGQMVTLDVANAGAITVVYARDPEGNVIELQRWGG